MLAQLLFNRFDLGVANVSLAIHFAVVVAMLAGVAFVVALFPATRWGRHLAAVAGIALLAPLHAMLSLLDLVAMVMFHLTGLAAPFLLLRTAPGLVMSLLNSIGIDAVWVTSILLATLTVHVLLYLPVAGLLVDGARRAMLWRPALTGRRVALRWLVLPFAVILVIRYPLLLVGPGGNPFVVAPPGLLDGHGAPSTAHEPESDLPGARPLVLVIVDALRRDRMGVYDPGLANTPFLSGLKAEGRLHVVDPAFSSCTQSYCGIIGTLSSHSWDDFGTRPATIIDVLGRHHYRSYLIMAGANTRYVNLIDKIGGPIASVYDEQPHFRAPADDRHVVAALRATRFADPRHSFLYLHLMSAHDGARLDPAFLAAARDRVGRYPYALTYDARVRQTDAVLRDVFAALRERGLSDALVVITADHGERIGEDDKVYHGGPPDPSAISIPLMAYDPRGAAAWPSRPIAGQIDVAPTLLAAVGGTPPREWRGTPLQNGSAPLAVPIGTVETTGLVAIVGGRQVEYRCDRGSGREMVTLLDGHGGGAVSQPARIPHLLALLRGWQRIIAPVPAGHCRH